MSLVAAVRADLVESLRRAVRAANDLCGRCGCAGRLVGLAGLAGVAATGVVLARERYYRPGEVLEWLDRRFVEVSSAPDRRLPAPLEALMPGGLVGGGGCGDLAFDDLSG